MEPSGRVLGPLKRPPPSQVGWMGLLFERGLLTEGWMQPPSASPLCLLPNCVFYVTMLLSCGWLCNTDSIECCHLDIQSWMPKSPELSERTVNIRYHLWKFYIRKYSISSWIKYESYGQSFWNVSVRELKTGISISYFNLYWLD